MMRCSSWSISSVWLTASAVRYMICRLLRARASQGLPDQIRVRKEVAALFPADRRNDSGTLGRRSAVDDIDFRRQVHRRAVFVSGEDHQGTADLDAITALEDVLVDALFVDERAVRTAQVDQLEIGLRAHDLSVSPRDLDVVQANRVGRFSADADQRRIQFEAFPLIASLDDEHTRHDAALPA